jgi:DNA-binding MarR family transcriptional regulator
MGQALSGMSALPRALRERLGLLLLRSHRAVKRLAEEKLAPIGVSTGDMAVLEMLRASSGLSQAELGTALGIDRTSVGALVAALEQRKIVERLPDPKDGRGYALRLTPAGRALADKASQRAVAAQAEFLAPLSEHERQQLISLLQRLLGIPPA